MKNLSCAAVWRRLSAFCDGELRLDEQIAVEAHLKGCDACRREADQIGELGHTLRASADSRDECPEAATAALQAAVLPRIKAERAASLPRQIEGLFEDLHLVAWAAGSVTVAMVICGLFLFTLLYEARAQPDSLAALVDVLWSESSLRVAPEPIVLPHAHPDAVMPATVMNQQSGEDAVSALAAVVTEDGSLSDIELLQPEGTSAAVRSVRQTRLPFDHLLDAASTARFEPARLAGAPVSVNVVWVLTHTTVYGMGRGLRAKATPVVPLWRPVGATAAPESGMLAKILSDSCEGAPRRLSLSAA